MWNDEVGVTKERLGTDAKLTYLLIKARAPLPHSPPAFDSAQEDTLYAIQKG